MTSVKRKHSADEVLEPWRETVAPASQPNANRLAAYEESRRTHGDARTCIRPQDTAREAASLRRPDVMDSGLSLRSHGLHALETRFLKGFRGSNIFGLHKRVQLCKTPLHEGPVGTQFNQTARITQPPQAAVHGNVDIGCAPASLLETHLSHGER